MEQDIEFRGFFYADGCALLVKYKRKSRYKDKIKTYTLIRPQLLIVQRADNLSLLEWIKNKFGGSIYKRNVVKHNMPGTKPAYQWICTNIETCKKITDLLLKTKIPYRSKDAIKAVNEYCVWRLKIGKNKKFNPDKHSEKIDNWRDRVFKAHKYKE